MPTVEVIVTRLHKTAKGAIEKRRVDPAVPEYLGLKIVKAAEQMNDEGLLDETDISRAETNLCKWLEDSTVPVAQGEFEISPGTLEHTRSRKMAMWPFD